MTITANKKGVSMIVSTMIIILLIIVAVGILWFVVSGAIKGSGGQFALGQKCIEINLEVNARCIANSSTDYSSNCTAKLERRPGGEDFEGLKLIFYNETQNEIVDVSGNIKELGIKTEGEITTSPIPLNGMENVTKLEVTAYFKDDSGREQLCSGAVAIVNF